MIEKLVDLIPPQLLDKSGAAFHSGRLAFSGKRDLYILQLNPGGDPDLHSELTVASNAEKILNNEAENWSAFLDESWAPRGNWRPVGEAPLQKEMQYLFSRLGINLREVPASDAFFVRSRQANDISSIDKDALKELCWKFHQAVIEYLGVRVVLCLYKEAAEFVRMKTEAYEKPIDRAFEQSKKKTYWRECFLAPSGLKIVQITRPTGIPWTENAYVLTKKALAG